MRHHTDSEHETDEEVQPTNIVAHSIEGYEWDDNRGGWFPKIDEDFIAIYQMNYGNYQEPPNTNPEPIEEVKQPITPTHVDDTKKITKLNKKKSDDWFELDDKHNKSVYVSNLPKNITMTEYEELMKKYGIIDKDMLTYKHKLKLYNDQDGNIKGDGLCTYIKIESVNLALNILDGSNVDGNIIKVEKARFERKEGFDMSKRPRRISKREKKSKRIKQEKLLDWRPDKRPKHEKTVVVSNAFDIDDFNKSPELILEVKEKLNNLFSKFGAVRKVMVYDRNPRGIGTVSFIDVIGADLSVKMMNNNVFEGRTINVSLWNGRDKFYVGETKEEEERRLHEWNKFIEGDNQ